MSYTVIDPIISTWAVMNHLTVHTEYKDTEVRSVEVVSDTGRKFQIWIDRPVGNTVAVHIWDYKKQRCDWFGTIEKLEDYLKEAISTVKEWASK